MTMIDPETLIDRIEAGDVDAIRGWTEDDDVCHSELARAALRGLLVEIDRLRRCEDVLRTYGHAIDACDRTGHAQDARAEYEADVAMEDAFEALVEVAKDIAEKEKHT